MLDLFHSYKALKSQTPEEKMYILSMIGRQMQGAKWVYYQKIKRAGENHSIFREKTIMELMKATQAALRFTSRSIRNLYRTAYNTCLRDITTHTGIRKNRFPKLSQAPETYDSNGPTVTSKITDTHDSIIISWTPIKFLIPAKTIREKGRATQHHTEGVVTKLFFKVVAYYATGDNWEPEKLTIYLRNLHEKSTYSDAVSALEDLKCDLSKFLESYQLFMFGKMSTSKDSVSDENVFDDDINIESVDDQVRTLYWYNFIYSGMELFLFRYFLTLVTSTDSMQAVRYLAQIFEPVLIKAIEVKNVFLGSFETDITKKSFRVLFRKYCGQRAKEPIKKKLKTTNGLFETYNYTLRLLEEKCIRFELNEIPKEQSAWGKFINYNILNGLVYKDAKEQVITDPIPIKYREYALMYIMNTMIICTKHTRRVKHHMVERFKKRVKKDIELAKSREKSVRKQAEAKIKQMKAKVAKLRRMNQADSADIFELDIAQFEKKVGYKCDSIRDNTKLELILQKERLRKLFADVSKQEKRREGISSQYVLKLINSLDLNGNFASGFTNRICTIIQFEYCKELEPFYNNVFDILNLSTQEKVKLIQSLEKLGGEGTVKLSLTDEEEAQVGNMITLLKNKIKHEMPDVFECKLVYMATLIPIEKIFAISIDTRSLQTLLRLKTVSPRNTKPFTLKEVVIKALTVLNMAINPVPRFTILQDDCEQLRDPQKAINGSELNRLLDTVT